MMTRGIEHRTKTERTRGRLRAYATFQSTLATAQVSLCFTNSAIGPN